MTLPATGSISFNQINTEIQRTSTAALSLNDSTVRTVAGVGGSGTAISMSNLRGKSYFTRSNPAGFNGNSYTDTASGQDQTAICTLTINTDGTWTVARNWEGITINGNWGSPTTAGIGSNYWVQFVLNSTSGSSTNTSWTTTTSYQQLTTGRSAVVSANYIVGSRTRTANYTVNIATDSSGTGAIASTITLIATVTA